jgi:tetratricopeptide (TPR) repeat protein
MISTLKFCGRSAELKRLVEQWRLASNIESPTPQVVVIKSERGVGKTRLALEFYRHLSQTDDQPGTSGYWPDITTALERNLEVNPEPHTCNFSVPIPYLWWGLRAGDPGAENGVAGDAIATYDKYLAPHLVLMLVRARMKNRALEFAQACGSVGIDLASSALQVDNLLTIGKGIFAIAKILTGAIRDEALEGALAKPVSRADAVLSDMEKVFNAENLTYAKTPGVIFLDDAQFASEDTALLSFVERVMHKAVTQAWPIMILVTHWKAQLSPEVMQKEHSFAGVLRHAREGLPTDKGPAANLPGGYLVDANYAEIDLSTIADLSEALDEKLPGLTEQQSEAILERTGGNSRYLEQVIQFAREHEGFFEDFDSSKALTDAGFKEILEETISQDIFKVVRRRLIGAPMEVQEAICLASLQGVRFANDLVDAVARSQISRDVRTPLGQAEDPWSWVAGTKNLTDDGVGAFVERLFHQVAVDVRPHVKSLGTEPKLQVTFRDTIKRLVEDHEFAASGRLETQLIAYSIAADLFGNSSEPDERALAQKALSLVAKVHLSRFSLESAVAAYERLLAIEPISHYGIEWKNRIDLLEFLVAAYRKLNWPSKCSSALKKMVWHAYHPIEDNGRILAFTRDQEDVRKYFESWMEKRIASWKQDAPDVDDDRRKAVATEIYRFSVVIIVKGILGLSELARSWRDLSFDEGDDPVGEAPFMIRAHEDEGDEIGKATEIEPLEAAHYLRDRAYNLGTFIGPDFAEREHFELLVDDIARINSDALNLDMAIDALQRALRIAEGLDDYILQTQALSNLGMVYGQKGDREQSEKLLLEAGHISHDNYTGESFSAVALSSGKSVEYRRADAVSDADQSRILGHLDIPIKLASVFDRDPDEAVRQFRQLIRMVGNIEGNLGNNALDAGEFEKAEARYKNALANYADLNDGPSIALTLANVAVVAQRRGDLETACDYWRQSISVYKKLKEVHSGDVRETRWNDEIKALEKIMKESGC